MTEIQQVKDKRTLGSRLTSTVLVFTVPILLLAIIGLFGGSFGIGTPEIAILWVIWIVGLIWVWVSTQLTLALPVLRCQWAPASRTLRSISGVRGRSTGPGSLRSADPETLWGSSIVATRSVSQQTQGGTMSRLIRASSVRLAAKVRGMWRAARNARCTNAWQVDRELMSLRTDLARQSGWGAAGIQ